MTQAELAERLAALGWNTSQAARRLNFPRRGLQLVLQGREPVPSCLLLAVRYLATVDDPDAVAEADNTYNEKQFIGDD